VEYESAGGQAAAEPSYPVTLAIDFPDKSLNRLSTFFRIFAVIPIAIVISLLGHSYGQWNGGTASYGGSIGLIFAPLILMLLFRQKYPRWWFDFNRELFRFGLRVSSYVALMDDRYPSTDEQQWVHFEMEYPDAEQDLNRALPLVKWFLAIPHYIVLVFLTIGAFFVVVFAWFAILFTGRYPRGAFDFVEGVYRWHSRVAGYALLLVTDRYPPFSLD
jgi:hypothetical protein